MAKRVSKGTGLHGNVKTEKISVPASGTPVSEDGSADGYYIPDDVTGIYYRLTITSGTLGVASTGSTTRP